MSQNDGGACFRLFLEVISSSVVFGRGLGWPFLVHFTGVMSIMGLSHNV